MAFCSEHVARIHPWSARRPSHPWLGVRVSARASADAHPMALRHSLHHLLEQIALCERGMQDIEQELDAFARRNRRSQLYLQAGGVGLLPRPR